MPIRKSLRFWRGSILAATLLSAPAAFGAPAPTLPPLPPRAEQLKSMKLVEEAYKGEFTSAQSASARSEMAGKLMETGDATKDDPAGQCALYVEAEQLAMRAGDFEQADQCVSRIASRWRVDELKMHADALIGCEKQVRAPVGIEIFMAHVEDALAESVRGARFDLAARLVAANTAVAAASADAPLVAEAKAIADDVTTTQSAYARLQATLADLKRAPGPPAAAAAAVASAVGTYQCFTLGRWTIGLPGMKQSVDPAVAGLARQELSADSPQATAASADAWWSYADAQTGLTQRNIRLHAAALYSSGLAGLTGVRLADAKARIDLAGAAEGAGGLARVLSAFPEATDADARIAVVNQTNAPEARAIVESIVDHYPDALSGVTRVELVKYHDGADLKRHGGQPRPIAGACSSAPVVGGGGGIWLWGIYETLPPGAYLIVYRIKPTADVRGENICFCDVCTNGGTIAAYRPSGDELSVDHWSDLPLALDLKVSTVVEYRLWPNGHSMALDRVYIFRVTR